MRIVLPLVVLLALGAGAFWFISSSGDDDDGGSAAKGGTTTTAADAATLPGAEPEPGSPGGAFAAWVQAVVAGDHAEACTLLSRSTISEIDATGSSCETAMEQTAEATGAPKGGPIVRILTEKVMGDRAEIDATVGTEDPTDEAVVLVLEDGAWKVDLFAEQGKTNDPQGAASAACAAELRTLETAVEAYSALEGKGATDAQQLVDAGLITKLPENSKVNPDGTVSPIGDCL
jgi:hypothetical protein